jgi:FeS assembly SUF system protein
VGIFSFLTGKKDDEAAASERPSTTATAETAPPAALTADAPAADAADTPAAHTTADTPFTPPDAWNIDALTAPPPADLQTDAPQIGSADAAQTAALQSKIIEVVKTVYDPEIPVDIYELGLIYDIIVDAERRVLIKMTLTSPACPSAQQIPSEVRYKVKALPEVTDAWVEIVWDPPWTKERMSEAAKLALGFF